MAVFAGGLAVAGGVARLLDRDPRDQTWLDLATLSMASFKAARTIARDDVTSFIREPFVEGDPREPDQERPVQTGDMEQAIGELVTCSRCIGTWAAAGLATGQILTPRLGRMVTWTLAAAASTISYRQGSPGSRARRTTSRTTPSATAAGASRAGEAR
jgi:hypothetical protein